MQGLAALLNSLASLAWPLFAIFAFHTLKADIKKLLGRLRKGKLLGQEIELSEQLDQLKEVVENVKEIAAPANLEPDKAKISSTYAEKIRAEFEGSPLAAFLRLASDLELTVNQILLRTGWARGKQKMSLRRGFHHLPKEWLRTDIAQSIEQFSTIRNRIVHESGSVAQNEIKRAIDIGLDLLDLLQNLPIGENRVKDTVKLYQDETCTVPVLNTQGVRIVMKHPETPENIVVYPTKRIDLLPGKLVSLDWNMSSTWEKCFYNDPDDGQIKQAFLQAAEFTGQPLDDITY